MTKFLIDADIVAFKAATSVERPVDWGDGMWTLHAYEHEGIQYIHDYLNKVTDKIGEGEFVMFITDPVNWRKDILPSYKSNRKATRKPLLLKALRQYLLDEMGAVMVAGMEADDLLGITSTNEPDCVIVSEDKDLATIPCQLFNPAKDDAVRTITEDGCMTSMEMWAAVVNAYSKKGLSEFVATTQARVARICRKDNFDFNTGKVILWTPPT